jgi:hypothetical protein
MAAFESQQRERLPMKLKIILALAAIEATLAWQAAAQIYDTNNVFVQTFAGSGFFGYVDGQGTQTMFNSPTAVVADSVSNLFVWDNANHRIRKIATDGTVSTFAGGGILTTGYGTNVSLSYDSRSMTIDHSNALWLATSPYLFRIGSDGYVSYASSTGIGYGSGICVDSANNIYHGYGEMGDIHIDNFKATIQRLKEWRTETIRALEEVFPRAYEVRYFHCANIIPPARWEIQTQRDELKAWKEMLMLMRQNLERISDQLDRYTDLPLQARVYVEDVESFSKVRDINPERVRSVLKDGRIEIEEDKVQRAIENILGETFHKNDHGGEINDLSTHAKFCGGGGRRPFY